MEVSPFSQIWFASRLGIFCVFGLLLILRSIFVIFTFGAVFRNSQLDSVEYHATIGFVWLVYYTTTRSVNCTSNRKEKDSIRLYIYWNFWHTPNRSFFTFGTLMSYTNTYRLCSAANCAIVKYAQCQNRRGEYKLKTILGTLEEWNNKPYAIEMGKNWKSNSKQIMQIQFEYNFRYVGPFSCHS